MLLELELYYDQNKMRSSAHNQVRNEKVVGQAVLNWEYWQEVEGPLFFVMFWHADCLCHKPHIIEVRYHGANISKD